MSKENTKQKLLEMMEKVNPDFKSINEAVNADISNLQTITQQTPAMQTANTRIDTIDEFKSAFVVFVTSTGMFQKGKINSVGEIEAWVRDAITNEKFGFQLPQKK